MAGVSISIASNSAAAALLEFLAMDAADKRLSLLRLSDYFRDLASGSRDGGTVVVDVGGTVATRVGTFTDNPTANDTVVINGVTFTAKASGAGANEFNLGTGSAGAKAATCAAGLAAAINASVTDGIKGYFTAAAVAGAVTITAIHPGAILITVTDSMNNFTFASTTAGTAGTVTSITV